MMRRLLTFLSCLLLGIGALQAQDITVSGVVVDESGMEVIGATVVLKGTKVGTATGIDGDFTLKVPQGSTLVFSMVGMKTIEQKAKENMKVTMAVDEQLLDEVMVVAYGTVKKSQFTGSAGTVDASAISDMQVTNPVNALKGRVTGVQISNASGQPGQSSPEIRVRGISSIKAGNKPLIVVDGSPYDGDLNNINNSDIESLTVLKDAASAALYGARGANGVIIITTKKGKDGSARVTFEAKLGVNSKGVRDYELIKSPATYYEKYYEGLYNYDLSQGGTSSSAHLFANNNMINQSDFSLGYNVFNVPAGQTLIGDNGRINPNATLGNVVNYNGVDYLLQPDNWLDNAYKTSTRQEYNFSISAGDNKSTFYTSLNYLKLDGITRNSGFERISGRIKTDYQVNSWFKVGVNSDYSHYNTKKMSEDGSDRSSGNALAVSSQIAPIYPLFIRNGNGDIIYDSNGIKRYDYGNKDNAGLERPLFTNTNALSNSILDTNSLNGNTVNAVFWGEIRFLENFKFTTQNTVFLDEKRTSNVTNPYYGTYANSKGIVTKNNDRIYSYNFQQLLNYSKQFDKNSIDVLVGHEYNRKRDYYLSANRTYMFDPSNNELDGAILSGSAPTSYIQNYNVEGYLSRIQYDYDSKYFGSFSFRRDGSSKFHPDHRWGNFWSLGGAWIISKEEQYNIPWLNLLKLKASYGEQGNDQIDDYLYTNTYNIVNSSGNPAAVPNIKGNEKISWEKQGNFNTGVEFEVLNGKISGSLEYFYRKTTDMLSWFTLPPSYGFTGYYDNVGDMRNSGLELELFATPFETKNFKWDVRFNLTHVSNKITKIPSENKIMTVDGYSGYVTGNKFFAEGKPLFSYYLKKYAGVDESGNALYYQNVTDATTGKISQVATTDYDKADSYILDTTLPDVYGGFGTTLTYRDFDFSIDFAYQLGGKVYDSDYAYFMSSPTSSSRGQAYHKDILNSWTTENHSSIPKFVFGDTNAAKSSDRFLTSASYLSIQNISLGYNIPKHICSKMEIERLRVFMSADNVALFSKRRGLDPRQSVDGATTSSYYAPMRTISGGISLTF